MFFFVRNFSLPVIAMEKTNRPQNYFWVRFLSRCFVIKYIFSPTSFISILVLRAQFQSTRGEREKKKEKQTRALFLRVGIQNESSFL